MIRTRVLSLAVIGSMATGLPAHALDTFKPLKQTGAVIGALALSGIALQCAANKECKEGVRRTIVGTGAAVLGLGRQMDREARTGDRDAQRRREAEAFGNARPEDGALPPMPGSGPAAPAVPTR
jgi:hypothetical protein